MRYRGRTSGTFQRRGSEAGTPAMRALNAMGSAFARAHAQDFERRKHRAEAGRSHYDDDDGDDDSSHESEDDGYALEDPTQSHHENMNETSAKSNVRFRDSNAGSG